MSQAHLNLALRPCFAEDERFFLDLSQRFTQKESNAYPLGRASLPHVTLCQFAIEEDQIEQAWKRFEAEIPTGLSVSPDGLSAMPKIADSCANLFVTVTRTVSLDAAHQKLVGLLAEIGATPEGKFGASYFPHFTVGRVQGYPRRWSFDLTGLPMPEGEIPMYLALGYQGPHGQFPANMYERLELNR